MKIIRSSKCSLKFSTDSKLGQLRTVLSEYGKVVNIFIDYFWALDELPSKSKLLKPIVDIPKDTWLSARLRKVAAREAIDMILASRRRWKEKAKKPIHKGKRMNVSCTIADLIPAQNATNFDTWLHLASIGNKTILDLPIKLHKHYLKWNQLGKRLNAYIITDKYVQFSFEIETGKKKEGKKVIGIDTGINALASVNNGKQYGLDIKYGIERVKRCKHGSNGQKQARRALKQRIDEITIEVINTENPDLIVVEQLKNMGHKSKAKRLLAKNIRRSIGIWNWRYWLMRIEQQCETNRVSFRSVSPYYTSQTCPDCNHIDRKNRNGNEFKCLSCGHEDNADVNAALNIMNRFILGAYGTQYKQDNLVNVNTC
jgi:IS605 OrfB family transposase